MSLKTTFRRAVAKDLKQIEPMFVADSRDHIPDREVKSLFNYLCAASLRANCALIVAEQDEKIAGYALVDAFYDMLQFIYVDKEHRGRGLGRALIREAEIAAADLGMEIISLHVRENNAAAIQLYTTQGYHQAGYRPGTYINNVAALVFEKNLMKPTRKIPAPKFPDAHP